MYFILVLAYFYSISLVVDISSLGVANDSPWWCLFTYNLIHFSFIHLLINSFAFLSYWRILKRYINIYILISMMLFIPALAAYFSSYNTPTIGTSAIIYTMIGIYTTSIPLQRKEKIKYISMVLFSFGITGLFASSINTKIHVCSFVISCLISLLAKKCIYAKA